MTLRVRSRLERGGFLLDVDVELPGTGVTAVFGPSGAGKSTLLRCIAGLEPGVRGRISLADAVWQDDARDLTVPPHRRRVGYVFQEADLFPHLDVRGNLAYARRRAREERISTADAVAWLGVERLLDRKPDQLSGGERQRVSIARALVANPALLLMDEPLSSLDEASKRDILPYIEDLHGHLRIPVIYVSHSIQEVVRLADHMVWLADGRVRRSGSLAEVMREAGLAAWLGEEAGVVVEAAVESHDEAHHLTRLRGPWGPIHCRRHDAGPGTPVRLRILARDVSLGLGPETDSSILNEFRLEVLQVVDEQPGQVLVELGAHEGPSLLARVTTLSRERLGIEPGAMVHARVKSVALAE